MSDVVPLLKFTPSAQDPQVLEEITVQREPLVARLVEAALDPGGARHQLLIGPRGIGKTHLLSLVANRVRAEAAPGGITLAWLEEDPWGIGSYEKFLAAIVAGIAEERSDLELQARADELHATREGSGRLGEEALREAVAGSRLVLLVENLDDVFRRIGENGQERFRAFVEDWQQMLVVATAQQLFEGVQLHESPFYGFFAITRLEELSLDSATELMRRVAELRGDRELVRFLRSDVAKRRLAAVEALAGGHPRIWLLLSGCVSIDAIDELVPLFLEALDDLTPYYQDRLRELGVQQQELIVQLSEAGGALSNRALSERSGIAQNQVATILGQLAERGYVRRAEVSDEIASGDARLSYWELREPLMRLCLDVKQARGKPLRMVVEFLRAWYGPRLLDELMALPPTAELANTYVSEAFRTLPGALPNQELLRGPPDEILARIEAGLSADPERRELWVAKATALLMEDRFAEARDVLEPLVPSTAEDQVELGIELQLIAAKQGLGEPVDEEPVVERLLAMAAKEPDAVDTQEVVAMSLGFIGHHEKALEIFRDAIQLGSENASVLGTYGRSLAEIGRLDQALEVLGQAIDLDPDDPEVHATIGFAQRLKGDLEAARESFERAVELEPRRGQYNQYKGSVLIALDRPEEALESVERGLELNPESLPMRVSRGLALLALDDFEEALVAISEANEMDPENVLLIELRGNLLGYLGRLEEALDAFRRATDLEPENASAWSRQADLLVELDRFGEAVAAANRAVELDRRNAEYRFGVSEINFAIGELATGMSQLREALEIWGEEREGLPGNTEVICAALWDHFARAGGESEFIEQVIAAYVKADAVDHLGSGLVKSANWFAVSKIDVEMADAWVGAWAAGREVEGLQIPLRMLRAAVEWKKDQDRAHLLALPPEQREILMGLLTPASDEGP